jgi:hypothetical protein
VDGCCGQDRVLELRVLPSAEGGLRQEPLAQSLQGQRLGRAGPAPLQRVRGEVKEPRRGTCRSAGAGARARSAPRRRQRRGPVRRARRDGPPQRPRDSGSSCRAYHDGRREPPAGERPSQLPPGTKTSQRGGTNALVTLSRCHPNCATHGNRRSVRIRPPGRATSHTHRTGGHGVGELSRRPELRTYNK